MSKQIIELDNGCKEILKLMRAAGFDVCDQDNVDCWTWEEKLYFFDNYGPHYIPQYILSEIDRLI